MLVCTATVFTSSSLRVYLGLSRHLRFESHHATMLSVAGKLMVMLDRLVIASGCESPDAVLSCAQGKDASGMSIVCPRPVCRAIIALAALDEMS